MPYQHTARRIYPSDDGRYIPLMNGRAAQLKIADEPTWPFSGPRAVVMGIADEALQQADYCLDAPSIIPAGACRGEWCYEKFAAAVQITVSRG